MTSQSNQRKSAGNLSRRLRFVACLVVALLAGRGLGIAPLNGATSPTQTLRSGVNEVLAALNDLQSEHRELKKRLKQAIYPVFDFTEMAKRALGSPWRRLSAVERDEFVSVFRDLLTDAYADNIASYEGRSVRFTGESQDENFSQVDTIVLGADGQQYSINYRLHRVDGAWKAYDVIVESISLVNNYRSQFSRVLSRSSFDELLAVMKSKIK